MVLRSAIYHPPIVCLELRREAFEHLLVSLGVHLALQDLGRASQRQCNHFLAQLAARLVDFLLELSQDGGSLTLCLGSGIELGPLDQVGTGLVGLLNDFRCLQPRLAQLFLGLLLRQLQLAGAPLGSGEALRNLALALRQGPVDVRPDEFHREQDEHEERDALSDQGEVDCHARASPRGAFALDRMAYCRAPSSGLANISRAANATPMMDRASRRPAMMNRRTCSVPAIAG